MTTVARSWDRLNVFGKALVVVVPILVVMTFLAILAAILILPIAVDLALENLWFIRFLIAATAVLLLSVPTAFLIIYMEMKIIALMNLRVGPDRVGPFGSALSVVHGLKVLMKEDFLPTRADAIVFTWAPVVVYLAAIMTLLVIPFAPGFYGQDMNIGLLYVFAVGGLTVVGLLMGGWSSFNKYSLLGGLRSAAQMVSYEIPLTLSVVGLILLAGSMSLVTLVEQQSGSFLDWYVWQQPLGALIFAIAATAEANRAPFDLTEADSEIVAGFATEYSGMRFGFFFFAEYVNVFIISALTVTLFFGGWTAPFDWPAGGPGHPARGDHPVRRPVRRLPAPAPTLAGARHRLRHLQHRGHRGHLAVGVRRVRVGRRPVLVHGQDLRPGVHVRLAPWDAAPSPDRPAHGLRLEVASAGRPDQPVRDRRRPRRGREVRAR